MYAFIAKIRHILMIVIGANITSFLLFARSPIVRIIVILSLLFDAINLEHQLQFLDLKTEGNFFGNRYLVAPIAV